MVICQAPLKSNIFIVTRMYRANSEKKPEHYVFWESTNLETCKNAIEKIENNEKLTEKEEKEMSNHSGSLFLSTLKKIRSQGEKINFIPQRIWLDDTIYQIKVKIFAYLSRFEEKKFILPQNQQLWVVNDGKDLVLGIEFIKEVTLSSNTKAQSYPISYPPALDDDNLVVDEEFLTPDGERSSHIQVINRESDILYDFIKMREKPENTNRIFLYSFDDELKWSREQQQKTKNQRAKDNDYGKPNNRHKNGNISKRIMNGYFLKHWPFSNVDIDLPQIIRMYKEVKQSIKASGKVIGVVKEEKIDQYDPKLQNCIAWQLIIWSRNVTKDKEKPFHMSSIYTFLRSMLSEKMPFIYYTSSKEKKPFISVYDQSIRDGSLKASKIKDWIFLKSFHLFLTEKKSISTNF
jgi:hypothetical protein